MKVLVHILTFILGVMMLKVGHNKFFEPSKTKMYEQIKLSELPFTDFTYWLGISSEVFVGFLLVLIVLFAKKINDSMHNKLFYFGHFIVVTIMIVAVYVHLHPAVPSELVPMGKTPIFPLAFMFFALINAALYMKTNQKRN